MGAKARKRRAAWSLPKTFVEAAADKNGDVQRFDGEPRFLPLAKHENDRSLCTSSYGRCCGCGLEHHYTYNVIKTPDGEWYVVVRAYRVPGSGR